MVLDINKNVVCSVCNYKINRILLKEGDNSAFCENCQQIQVVRNEEEDEKLKKVLLKPKKLKVNIDNNKLEIKYPLDRENALVLVVISLMIPLILIIRGYNFEFSNKFLIIYAIIIGYFSIVYLVNYIVIEVNRKMLKVKYSPLPIWFTKKYYNTEIKQLYVKENIIESKNQVTAYYQLRILLNNKKDKNLLGLNLDSALYLENIIEEYLEIEDKETNLISEYRET